MASKRWISLIAALALAGCGDRAPKAASNAVSLEAAARSRGLVVDPADAPLTGLYARDSDRLCLVEQGGAARIGVVSDYGEGLACAATGVARRSGDSLSIELGATGDCTFTAQFDGERIVFPARLSDGCRRFCGPRASLSAFSVERLSASASEASALRDPQGRLLCPS
ncbi:hypothetical protein COC42_02070 [Sphingomonas spermidinifaciens]|uniref:Lipoprotein n=1 Tax=Sphingomonas spermidinifaciens TaxID=1141889 RepID=A0A2A4B584_9SPHN|nr:hypothetical protein [Sphingomonas spermidinifaciens]PCD03227.1 hypothetical protein COC42_02070 [Sphingomonas spermidinifaciens]